MASSAGGGAQLSRSWGKERHYENSTSFDRRHRCSDGSIAQPQSVDRHLQGHLGQPKPRPQLSVPRRAGVSPKPVLDLFEKSSRPAATCSSLSRASTCSSNVMAHCFS